MTEERVTNFVAVHRGSYYDSDFESEGELDQEQRNKSLKRKHEEDNDDELSVSRPSSSKKKKKKHKKERRGGPAKRNEVEKEYCKEASRTQRFHIVSMDAYSRHKKFINDYMMYYRGSQGDYKPDTSKYKTDLDIIRENHKFLWNEDSEEEEESWEKRLAKKYYDKLFKEYCITDLSRYKENKIAFRWQMEKEVVSGKGQFICANKVCAVEEGLRSWEVNFGYLEEGQKKNALVKVRLCPDCSYKINYHKKRKDVTKNRSGKGGKRRNANEDSVGNTAKDKGSLDNDEEDEEETAPPPETEKDESVWTKRPQDLMEKSRDEEFEEYFEDMFL